jgi:serine/threonine-protein kinase
VGAVAAVALVLLAAVVFAALRGSGGSGTSAGPTATTTSARTTTAAPTTTAPTTTAAPTTPVVQLAADRFVGHPVHDVQRQLAALGFQVQLRPVTLEKVPAGRVVDVSPSGAVPAGSAVTVTYAAAPPPKHHGKGHGHKDD